MSITSALGFIEQGLKDSAFRGRLNSASIETELNDVLAKEEFIFSKADFNNAFLQRLTRCQETEEAEQLKEFKLWWGLLCQSIEPMA